jgi:hypothetical protein
VARKFCRNRYITRNTSAIASQGDDHALDRDLHERRGVKRHHRLQARREERLQFVQRGLDSGRGIQGVGSGSQRDRHASCRLAVVVGQELVVLRTHFHAGDIAQRQHRAVGIAAQHDRAELLGRLQAVLRADGGVDLLALDRRRGTERAHRDLRVLRLQRGDQIPRRQPVGVQLVRIQPDAHGVFRAKHLDGADTGNAAERIDQGGTDVIGNVVLGHAAIGGDETDDLQEATA